MATTTWNVNKDARIALRTSDSWEAGSGTSDGLPVGQYSGYRYRTLLGFNYSWTGMVSITSAILHIKTSNQIHIAFGSDPDVEVYRLTASWSEGTSSGLSASNAVTWDNQPAATATNMVTFDCTTSESTWEEVDITDMINDVFGGTFHGLRLNAVDETISSDVTEFFSREYGGSHDAYIEVTYTTNTVPDAPTLTSPANGATAQSLTPSLVFEHNDDQSDPVSSYDLQVSTDSTFASVTHWTVTNSTTGVSGDTVTRTYSGTALSNNTVYYWRARTADADGDGAWSSTRSFRTAQLPTGTLTEPSATGRLGKLTYTAGSGWAAPRLNVSWTFNCPDGGTQASYEVEVNNDSAGSVGSSFHDTGTVSSTATTLVVSTTLTEGNYYHVRVRVTCSHGQTSAFTSYYRIRVRWGLTRHIFDMGSVPVSWSTGSLSTTTSATSSVTVEYASNSSTTLPTTWFSSIASETKRRYFFYRVWLLAWGSSPATSPSFNSLVLTYSTNVLTPDVWVLSDPANALIDTATYVYGTQSLQLNGTGSTHTASQLVQVTPDTDYVLSARIRNVGDTDPLITISEGPVTGAVAGSNAEFPILATADWQRVNTQVWNSGANTEIYITCRVGGASGSAWFDAVKMEASRVVTPWSPSFLADAVVLDAGGLQIDASKGGIFRLRGAGGGSRDLVELGTDGLLFGGSTDGVEVYSPSADMLQVGGSIEALAGTYGNLMGMVAVSYSATTALAGTGTVDIPLSDAGGTVSTYRAPFAGRVVAIAMTASSDRTAGTLTAQVFNASTSSLIGLTCTHDAVGPNLRVETDALAEANHFSANQQLRLRLTTSGYTPTANTVKVIVFLAFAAQ